MNMKAGFPCLAKMQVTGRVWFAWVPSQQSVLRCRDASVDAVGVLVALCATPFEYMSLHHMFMCAPCMLITLFEHAQRVAH